MIAALSTTERIVHAFRDRAVRVTDEAKLQVEVARLFADHGIPFEEQVVLGPGERIDFLCDGVGVELKTKGGLSPLIRQLARYAAHERVTSLVVISTRRQLLSLPVAIGGKAVVGIGVGSL